MTGNVGNVFYVVALGLAMLMSQASNGDEGSSEGAGMESGSVGYASFTVTGAQQDEHVGVAKVEFLEYSRHETRIVITDSDNPAEQSFELKIRADSHEFLGLPEPGEYPITNRRDPATGFDGGFSVDYAHIIENRGGYYKNVALEYDVPLASASVGGVVNGKVVIEAVDDNYVTGRFEFDLRESGSFNNAPRNDEKVIAISEGRFKARVYNEVD